jgi:hypothetical protein
MKTSKVLYGVGLLILLVLAMGVTAYAIDQGLQVKIPNEVLVNGKRLPAGEYEIRKVANLNTVFQFYNRDDMKYETYALPIRTEADAVVEDPKIVMQKVGNDYYLTEIWLSGSKSGYELPLPERARALQRELEQTVSGEKLESTPVASNRPAASSSVDAQAEKTPDAAADQSDQPQSPAPQVAQNVPSQQAPVDPRPREDTSPAAEQTPANVQGDEQPSTLPATASHWFVYVLMGGVLSALAIVVRRV